LALVPGRLGGLIQAVDPDRKRGFDAAFGDKNQILPLLTVEVEVDSTLVLRGRGDLPSVAQFIARGLK
jgi:hypothetical protein